MHLGQVQPFCAEIFFLFFLGKLESGDRLHNPSFSSYLTNGPNKLECLLLGSLSGLVLWNALVHRVYSKVTKNIMRCCEYRHGGCGLCYRTFYSCNYYLCRLVISTLAKHLHARVEQSHVKDFKGGIQMDSGMALIANIRLTLRNFLGNTLVYFFQRQ